MQSSSATLEVLAVSYETEDNLTKWYIVYFWYLTKEFESYSPEKQSKTKTPNNNNKSNQIKQKQKIYHTNDYGSFNCNCQNSKVSKMPFIQYVDK